MLEFIKSNPEYLLILIVHIIVVFKVLVHIKNADENGNDDDEGGGEKAPDFPVLDLPPGVSLPKSRRDKELI
jgi:hypothetical protein